MVKMTCKSLAVDGVSLTVATVTEKGLREVIERAHTCSTMWIHKSKNVAHARETCLVAAARVHDGCTVQHVVDGVVVVVVVVVVTFLGNWMRPKGRPMYLCLVLVHLPAAFL